MYFFRTKSQKSVISNINTSFSIYFTPFKGLYRTLTRVSQNLEAIILLFIKKEKYFNCKKAVYNI